VLAGGQALVEAAEEASEEVALGGGVAVPGVAAAVIVGAGARGLQPVGAAAEADVILDCFGMMHERREVAKKTHVRSSGARPEGPAPRFVARSSGNERTTHDSSRATVGPRHYGSRVHVQGP